MKNSTPSNCPLTWIEYNGSCYRYSYFNNRFSDADGICRKHGSNLVTFSTSEEKDAIRNLIPIVDLWIGCYILDNTTGWNCSDSNQQYLDSSGYPIHESGAEEDRCLVMNAAGEVQTEDCSTKLRSVCQMPKDEYIGCYIDVEGDRALAGGHFLRSEVNGKAVCTEACHGLNYVMAGLGQDADCFCGNRRYSRHGRVPEWECSRSCTGLSICGGVDRVNVFRVGSKADNLIRSYTTTKYKRLNQEVYTVIPARSIATCANACTSSTECLSFNYCNTGQSHECELNYDTRNMRPDSFEDNAVCEYGEVEVM